MIILWFNISVFQTNFAANFKIEYDEICNHDGVGSLGIIPQLLWNHNSIKLFIKKTKKNKRIIKKSPTWVGFFNSINQIVWYFFLNTEQNKIDIR